MPDSRVLRNHKGDSNMAESKQLLKAAYEYYLFGLVEDTSLPKSAFGWKPGKHGACDSLAGSSSIRVRFCLLEKARCKWEPPWDHRRADTIMSFQLSPDTAKSEQLCDPTRGNTSIPLHSDASKLCTPALISEPKKAVENTEQNTDL